MLLGEDNVADPAMRIAENGTTLPIVVPTPFNPYPAMEEEINDITIRYVIIGCVSFVASTMQVQYGRSQTTADGWR